MFCKWPSFTPHFSIQGETKQVPGTIHNFSKGKPKQNSSKLSLASRAEPSSLSLITTAESHHLANFGRCSGAFDQITQSSSG